jgi:hypothetical protein
VVVLLVSALVLQSKFDSPFPYVFGGIAAAGAITIVSVLWADAAESPPPVAPNPQQPGRPQYRGLW